MKTMLYGKIQIEKLWKNSSKLNLILIKTFFKSSKKKQFFLFF